MLKLYDFLESGNGYKVRLLLHQLDVPFERIELDITRGQTRTPEFLARNRNGRIPVLELEDGTALAESNAIQFYLAEGTPFLPAGRIERAQVLQWMFFEQYSHEPYIAVVRFWCHTGEAEKRPEEVAARRARGYDALAVMEDQPAPPRLVRRGPLHDRRHRALRLHPRRARGRLRSRALSRRERVARARAQPAAPHPDHAGLVRSARS
jgi:glutathione S-transferase